MARMNPVNDAAPHLSIDELEASLATMSDSEVRAAYRATDGMPGNQVADLLAGECERRNLDL